MKIYETPELKVKNFNRVNILTVSGETPTNAVEAAKATLEKEVTEGTSIFSFATRA